MSPSVMTPEPSPRRPCRLRTSTDHPPVVARPSALARTPSQPLARLRPVAGSTVPPVPMHRRRLSLVARIALGIVACVLTIGGMFVTRLLMGQDELIAWLVVGAVLVVVFGTPLLCLVGLVVFYVWALTRAGRRRSLPPQPRPAPTSQAQPIIVGEVVFDD